MNLVMVRKVSLEEVRKKGSLFSLLFIDPTLSCRAALSQCQQLPRVSE